MRRERGTGAGHAQRQYRRAERDDPERGSRVADGFDLFSACLEGRQSLARRDDFLAIHRKLIGRPDRYLIQVDMKSETIADRYRRQLIFEPFVQRDHAEPGRHPQRKPVTLDDRLPRIHRGGDMYGRRGRQPFRHRHHEHPAIGFRQQPAFGHRPSGEQGRVEVEPTEQASIGNMQRQMFQRLRDRQCRAQHRQPALANRAGARADQNATGADRIDREQLRRGRRIGPGERGRHPNTSAMARSTRTLEPASSSGLRRRR